jgi:hypothetical protein
MQFFEMKFDLNGGCTKKDALHGAIIIRTFFKFVYRVLTFSHLSVPKILILLRN